jgi:hypothetical protein
MRGYRIPHVAANCAARRVDQIESRINVFPKNAQLYRAY